MSIQSGLKKTVPVAIDSKKTIICYYIGKGKLQNKISTFTCNKTVTNKAAINVILKGFFISIEGIHRQSTYNLNNRCNSKFFLMKVGTKYE